VSKSNNIYFETHTVNINPWCCFALKSKANYEIEWGNRSNNSCDWDCHEKKAKVKKRIEFQF